MANVNAILNGATLQAINTIDGTTRVNSASGNPTLNASTVYYDNYYEVLSSGSTISIPLNTAWVVWVRNLGGQNSTPAGNITVRFTVAGGSQIATADSPIIPPGGIFAYWCTSESAGGFTGLTLIASVNATPAEIMLAS